MVNSVWWLGVGTFACTGLIGHLLAWKLCSFVCPVSISFDLVISISLIVLLFVYS